MPQLQISLVDYIYIKTRKNAKIFSPVEILEISVQMIKAIEIIHESGKSHNTLSLSNIMKTNENDLSIVILIDFDSISSLINEPDVEE